MLGYREEPVSPKNKLAKLKWPFPGPNNNNIKKLA
jgi:hypothetical protein